MCAGISQYEAHFVSCEAAIVEIPPVLKIRPANQYIDHSQSSWNNARSLLVLWNKKEKVKIIGKHNFLPEKIIV
jgi:hypothetical protein